MTDRTNHYLTPPCSFENIAIKPCRFRVLRYVFDIPFGTTKTGLATCKTHPRLSNQESVYKLRVLSDMKVS